MSNKSRKLIKQKIELFALNAFIDEYNKESGTSFVYHSSPDPPDAIFKDDDAVLWLEHALVYRDIEEAREEWTDIAPDEKLIPRSDSLIGEPDNRICNEIRDILDKKLSKPSYERWYLKYGKGVLILRVRDPLFSESTLRCLSEKLEGLDISSHDRGYFKKVFLFYQINSSMQFLKIYVEE